MANQGSVSSSSIRDTYERDFYLLKHVIKQHDNVIECVRGWDVEWSLSGGVGAPVGHAGAHLRWRAVQEKSQI